MSETSRRAFSLAEVMVLIALVTMALFALIASQFYAYKASKGSRQRQIAASLAYSYLNSAEDALRRDFYLDQSLAMTPLTDPAGFRVAMSDVYAADGLDNLKIIACSIYWDEAATEREYRAHLDIYLGPN